MKVSTTREVKNKSEVKFLKKYRLHAAQLILFNFLHKASNLVYYGSEIEIKAKVESLEKSEVKERGQEKSLAKFECQENNEVKVEIGDRVR